METKIEKINAESLNLAKKLILEGEIVAFPTETVYGLGANIFDEKAVKKIFEAKGRPSDNPLIAHVADAKTIELLACDISDKAKKIINELMPGSLTIVLKKKTSVPDLVTANLDTVAIRMPLSTEARAFISACGVPIAAPSANLSSRPSPTTYQAVFEDLNGKIPLILAGRDCEVGIESTVLDMTAEPTILRPGIVTAEQIEKVLGEKVLTFSDKNRKVNSPGMRYRHYAPSIPAALDTACDVKKVTQLYDKLMSNGQKAVILCLEQYLEFFENKQVYSLGKTEKEAANKLFSALRECEKKYDYIIEMFCPKTEEGFSVLNRMIKSVGENFI
ncbi:MAG TPA: L-threonylcarbamoyladenylate synthase [Eubacteriales bacterium]|nr:L-threonylcarbamoyladenylate synthase [Eubacteriales bacterium]